jgi:hypothetical protein
MRVAANSEKIIVENINTPVKTSRVDSDKYISMKQAMLKVLPGYTLCIDHHGIDSLRKLYEWIGSVEGNDEEYCCL